MSRPKAVSDFWQWCREEHGCVITGHRGPHVTIHHIHSREVTARFDLSGMARKSSDWLVIPLAADLHVGNNGVDVIGVKTWEKRYGSQLQHFCDMICDYTGEHPYGARNQ